MNMNEEYGRAKVGIICIAGKNLDTADIGNRELTQLLVGSIAELMESHKLKISEMNVQIGFKNINDYPEMECIKCTQDSNKDALDVVTYSLQMLRLIGMDRDNAPVSKLYKYVEPMVYDLIHESNMIPILEHIISICRDIDYPDKESLDQYVESMNSYADTYELYEIFNNICTTTLRMPYRCRYLHTSKCYQIVDHDPTTDMKFDIIDRQGG